MRSAFSVVISLGPRRDRPAHPFVHGPRIQGRGHFLLIPLWSEIVERSLAQR
jgi:hypothetical protein